MKYTYPFLFCICFAFISRADAQCTPLIPSNVQIIPFGVTDSSYDHPGSTHHVCFNSFYYYYNNNPDTIYLEGSARLTVGFSTNLTVYMQNNAQLIIDTTTSGLYDFKKIVYDPTFTLFVDTSYATIDSLISCPGMTYNYSNFSGSISPCDTLGLEDDEANGIRVFPTATNGDITVETDLSDFDVDIYDLLGKKISHVRNQHKISINDQPTGMYLVSVINENGKVFMQKVFLTR